MTPAQAADRIESIRRELHTEMMETAHRGQLTEKKRTQFDIINLTLQAAVLACGKPNEKPGPLGGGLGG